MSRILAGILFFFIFSVSQAQTYSIIDGRAIKLYQEAEELTLSRQYDQAISKYQAAINREASFLEAYVKMSQLLITQGKIKEAEEVALNGKKRLSGKNATTKNVADYGWLFTNLYMSQGKFQEAFDTFNETDPLFDQDFKKTMYYVQMKDRIDFLKNMLVNVMAIEKEKLSEPINKFQLQYFPVLTADGEQILFTKRDGTGNFDKEDIFTSYLEPDGSWTNPVSIAETINSQYNEGTCSVTADGNILIYTSCDAPDSEGSCDLYIAYKVNGNWQRPTNMGKKVNSRSWDSQPSLSADGRILFFSSNRRGGYGGNDIWYSVRQNDGSWSEAKNLGNTVNTAKDEISPFMFFNNEILFFASDGHPGFGGMDIFLSRVENTEFSVPENLGLPINDQLDQVALFITAQKDYAYFTELTTGENGNDRSLLYRFKFPEEIYLGENLTVTGGKVFNAKTGEPIDATLSLVSLTNDSTLYEFQADGKTGEFMMLYPDKAISGLYVEKKGFLPKIFNVERDKLQNVEDLNVELVPVASGEEFVFENIFFDFDKYELKSESMSSLRRLVKFLKENPNVNILITGHTDNVGSPGYNLQLSLQRAESVQKYLVDEGMHPARVLVEGKGDKEPVVPNTTAQNQALNRRITIKVL
ncbi:outer membrane protein OmpA-like peptidoglycan-associated protein/tetratricopeptide (TPR) repeat protein [Algoriphagus iocasae]|uniref:Outer membrane protein OmpA-like peptidoglycan-associated protein/tetratricopeptide (TPR) repeat protein n=1 Tax=Algoriphagus iocasae TaxID=1836499 RepID=A0A841MXC9_9BACT|nr:OmpA family protein [Algoriphagus iocasae]MBB6328696.1 outer membrane protein OmpA-like peptidoglycan-associated protein/tetratricopeptide (TPR) repeat protein [Algoriphagus iocasae]